MTKKLRKLFTLLIITVMGISYFLANVVTSEAAFYKRQSVFEKCRYKDGIVEREMSDPYLEHLQDDKKGDFKVKLKVGIDGDFNCKAAKWFNNKKNGKFKVIITDEFDHKQIKAEYVYANKTIKWKNTKGHSYSIIFYYTTINLDNKQKSFLDAMRDGNGNYIWDHAYVYFDANA